MVDLSKFTSNKNILSEVVDLGSVWIELIVVETEN